MAIINSTKEANAVPIPKPVRIAASLMISCSMAVPLDIVSI